MEPLRQPKQFIIAGRCGRLANRLIFFANFAALAEEQGHDLINFTFHSYSESFAGTRQNIYCRYPRPARRSWLDGVPGVAAALRWTRLPYHLTRRIGQWNKRFPLLGRATMTLGELPGTKITRLDGPAYQEKIRPAKRIFVFGWWLRAPELVQKHGDKIRAYFQPIEPLARASRAAVEPLRRAAEVVIGVHIRQGDYRTWCNGRYFFPAPRYAAWMQELAAQFPGQRVAFLVCSDEPRHAGEFPGLIVGFGTPSPVSDIYALAQCDYLFGPKSTFSQWASFYGNKPLFQLSGAEESLRRENFRVSYLDWD